MKHRNHEAFTLIELLVVISIVALLSSVVLASLNTAREKAKIAAGQQFESNIFHATGDFAVGIWDFNECTGSTTLDRSGFNNNGTLVSSVSWSGNTPVGKGCSLYFDGSSGYVLVPHSNSLNLASGFTISVWVNVESYPTITADPGIISKGGYSEYLLRINRTSEGNAPAIFINDGVTVEPRAQGVKMPVRTWFHLAATYDPAGGSGNLRLYVNGSLVGKSTRTGQVAIGTGSLFFSGGSSYFNGFIDDPKIFSKSFTALEIEKLYASEILQERIANAVQ